MQIIEVRNDILRLAYSPLQNGILLSDFFLITEGSKSILAQVIGIESSTQPEINVAVLKGCLSVDEEGRINSYLGFVPSTGADVTPLSHQQVVDMINSENSISWGYLAQNDNVLFKTDFDLIKNKPLILVDDYENYNVIINNITFSNSQNNEKTVVVDFDGRLSLDNAFYIKVGEDLKFPLTFSALNYIYENDLKNESLSAHAVIQDVIIEIQDYIKSLKGGYLPFSTIKNVVYSQYEENKIPELMLLKNKFVKYSQQDFLAESEEDFNFLNSAIKENNLVIIDATSLEPIWHRYLLNYLSKSIKIPCSFIAKLENDNSNKKTILDIYNNHALSPILAASYTHECATVLKSIAKNMILFPPVVAVNDFSTYSSFMKKLNRDEYIICGENTLYLSFLVRLIYINSNMSPDYIEREIQQDVDKLYRAGSPQVTQQTVPEPQPEPVSTNQPTQTIDEQDDVLTENDLDYLDEIDALEEDDEIAEENSISPAAIYTPNEYAQEDYQNYEDDNMVIEENEEEQFEPTEEIPEVEEQEFEEPLEAPVEQNLDTPIDDYQEEYNAPTNEYIEEYQAEEPVEEIAEEVNEPEQAQEPQPEPPVAPKKKPAPAESIPVYSVPELDADTPPEFSEGNIVYHEKYGKGVIEKIMNYGSKTLCSIQFEEVGRRLLDPNLAGLKQV